MRRCLAPGRHKRDDSSVRDELTQDVLRVDAWLESNFLIMLNFYTSIFTQ